MNGLLHRIDFSLCEFFEKDCIRFGAKFEQIAELYDYIIFIAAKDDATTKQVFDGSFYGGRSVLICYNLHGNRCSLFALNGSEYELFKYTSSIPELCTFIDLCKKIGSVRSVKRTKIITNISVIAKDTDDGVNIYYPECTLSFRKPETPIGTVDFRP